MTALLVGTNIVLRRQQGAWQLFMGYPAGATLPPNGSPCSFFLKDLSAAYAHILEYHSDVRIPSGMPPSADPSAASKGTVNDGDIYRLEMHANGWTVLKDIAGGGFGGQMGKPHHSIGAALESIKMLTEVT